MWPFNKKHKDEIACQNIITDYLLLLPASGDWDDDEIQNKLVSKGHDKRLSWFVIALISGILAHEYLKQQGVNCLDYLCLLTWERPKRLPRPIPLYDFPACRAIMQSRQRILAHSNIQRVMESSGEYGAVAKALKNGSKAEELKSAGVLLIKPDWM